MRERRTAYLALGSNLGDTEANIREICDKIRERAGEILCCSSLMTTEPEGFDSIHSFTNCAIALSTPLLPLELLKETQEIEKEMGRQHKSTDGKYKDRTADIDIILYDDLILSVPELEIPHPRFRERQFVLEPLAEIAPQILDPITRKTVNELLRQLTLDKTKNRLWPG